MATRSPASYLWSSITDLFDGDDLNRQKLYKEAIHRLQDYGQGVLDVAYSVMTKLASEDAGTPAVVRSTTVLGSLAFYDPVDVPTGALDGLTLILTTDLAAPVTITFAQPTSPLHAATQINTQGSALGIIATVDDGVDPVTGAIVGANVGKLRIVRPGGGTATITFGNGTANGVLGFTNGQSATGSGASANDGATKIGLAAFASPSGWPGGTLRDFLQTLFTLVDAHGTDITSLLASVATKVAKAGDTMTGALTTTGVTISNTSNTISLASRSVTRSGWKVLDYDDPGWAVGPDGGLQTGVNTAVGATIEIDVPNNAVLTSIAISYTGAGGHAGLPANMPSIEVFKQSVASGEQSMGTGTDTSVDVAAYQATHLITATVGAFATVDRTNARYYVKVESESGANALSGAGTSVLFWTATITELAIG